jgi:ribosomal protein S21
MSKNFTIFGDICNYMIIVNLDNKTPIDKAIKMLKNKVIKTKQNDILREKKEYTKKSVVLRTQKKKAIYQQKITSSR